MTIPTLKRLPIYLSYLNAKQKEGIQYISCTLIADALRLNPVQVRKDFSRTGCIGKPKTGFETEELIKNIKETLGYNNPNSAILVGAGKLGKTLISFKGFEEYGLKITAAFDTDKKLHGTETCGVRILQMDEMKDIIRKNNIKLGIITVPAEHAQKVCNMMTDNGISAIWNFAPVYLKVPKDVMVQNENMISSLAALSGHLSENYRK